MECSQGLSNSSLQSFWNTTECKQYQSQRLLHIDALSAKIDQVLTHQHELLALIRHASKSNSSVPLVNGMLIPERNLATKASTSHVHTLKNLLGSQGLLTHGL